MASNKRGKRNTAEPTSEARFPYTNKPGSLRKVLKEIPKRPKPPKFDKNHLKSWGFKDGNDYSVVRVLKAVRMLNENNEPSEVYTRFMNTDGGATVLGAEIKRLYAPLFTSSHKPQDEPSERLQNLFNIHSGGGERVISFQMQTFKALCDSAVFDNVLPASGTPEASMTSAAPGAALGSLITEQQRGAGAPVVNINLHIHLPENKTRRDYEDIIEDIGRYIFGRTGSSRRE